MTPDLIALARSEGRRIRDLANESCSVCGGEPLDLNDPEGACNVANCPARDAESLDTECWRRGPMSEDSEVVCGTVEASCVCGEAPHHDGPHVCHNPACNGSWTFDDRGRFVPVRFPGSSARVQAGTP